MRELFATICLTGALIALILFLALVFMKRNRAANRHLSLFMFFMALDAFELYLRATGHFYQARPYQLSIIPYSFIFGPSIFMYIATLTGRINIFSKRHLLLYVPFVVFLILNVVLMVLFENGRLSGPVLIADFAVNGGGLVVEAVFYILSLILLNRYLDRLKEYFSAIDTLKLKFLRGVLAILILVAILIFLSLAWNGYIRREYKPVDMVVVVISVGIGFAIAVTAMVQPEIFNRVRIIERSGAGGDDAIDPKYEKFRLPEKKEKEHAERLRRYMNEEKPYLQEDLTLQDLADELSLSTHHVSMLLNIHFKQNFYSFINSYRVEEVKRKLALPENRGQSILAIAYSAGFNSKSSFNTVFKKLTGMTPKEYRADLPA